MLAALAVPVPRFFWGIIVGVVYLAVVLLLWRIVLRIANRAAQRSATPWDDIWVDAFRGPVSLFILLSTIWVAARSAGVPANWAHMIDQAIRVGMIVAVVFFTDRLLRGAIDFYQDKLYLIHLTRGFARAMMRIVVMSLAGLIILDTLHISITPLLASLGVGGLAVGLALQGTLSNLFAGMQIISDRPVRVGDFVKLESGEEGYVKEIGWRATKIQMLPNNTVIIPNSKLADSVLTNYYLPEQELAVLVNVGVSYNSDLKKVESVTVEVAKEIQLTVPGAVMQFDPFIRYNKFDSSSINFTVIMRATEFVSSYLIKHEFIKRLHARYAVENIVIPFPIRTLDMPQDLLEHLRPNGK